MHLYKLNLLSQQGKLYLKAKTWILQCSRNSLFVNHRYLNQRNMRWGDLGLMFPFFFKAMWFYLKKAEFDLIKFAHTTAKAVTILLSWEYCPDNFVFKRTNRGWGGLGRGLRRGSSRRRRAQGTIAGLDHSDASLRGGGSSKNQGFFWIDGLTSPTRGVPYTIALLSASLCFLFII